MKGRAVAPEAARLVLGLIDAGMAPYLAAAAAGVSAPVAYKLAARRGAGDGEPWRDRRLADAGRERAVLELLAAGVSQRAAARAAGVSRGLTAKLAARMVRVPVLPEVPLDGRYLDREERYEIARLREAGLSVRAVAERLGRSPSTVCRELARNADPRTGRYMPERADRLARERQRRPKASKLSGNAVLRAAVQGMLERRYSPQQVSGRLKAMHPGDPAMQVSHETIYQSIYVYPRGGLKRELQASLRSGRALRRPRGRAETRGKIVGAVPIGQRPPEAEGRLVPGHHEGDLLMGSAASNSAVATVVERMTGYLTLIPLPHGHGADAVAGAVIDRMTEYPAWFARTLTWDNGKEMARHARITEQTGIGVYFADPYAPWQRGSNENINGLLREYLPKGTDLSAVTPEELQFIQDELNDRPRQRFGFYTPREQLAKLLENNSVATTP